MRDIFHVLLDSPPAQLGRGDMCTVATTLSADVDINRQLQVQKKKNRQ